MNEYIYTYIKNWSQIARAVTHRHCHHMTPSDQFRPSSQHGRGATPGAPILWSVVFVPTKWSRCSAGGLWRVMRSWVEWPRRLKVWKAKRLIKALEDEIPMALELVQSAFACPFMSDSPEPPGTADLGLGALFSANGAFSICSILCTDFLTQEKDWECHGALPDTV